MKWPKCRAILTISNRLASAGAYILISSMSLPFDSPLGLRHGAINSSGHPCASKYSYIRILVLDLVGILFFFLLWEDAPSKWMTHGP